MASILDTSRPKSNAEEEKLIPHSEDEEEDQIINQFYHNPKGKWMPATQSSLLTLVAITALTSTLLSGLAFHFFHPFGPQGYTTDTPPVPGTHFGSCGDTPSSARQANCVFDIMSFSWLPNACAEPELTTEFLGLRNWTWWIDADKQEPVPFDEVAWGDHTELYVTREYHMYHCTYMWRKLHRGLLRGQSNAEGRGVVDTYIGQYGHTAHCEMMLLGMESDGEGIDKTATDTIITMKFPQCMWT
ncbi:hypothetical protein L207DRAFT_262418 [Hyaloscypha variabilis F]|uniref:Uncharacterized protein n=1 Tax=Hyaloscypha variabilis (strain UAMH 11265 / GT02V1 / F) TaxID=1149755 RepID=A0A2J6QSB6_HYAVF|nr:hypothetical protein L207DRAFT_262418 [Hyaloscypha variabilis F]